MHTYIHIQIDYNQNDGVEKKTNPDFRPNQESNTGSLEYMSNALTSELIRESLCVCVCVCACTVYGLGNRCSYDDENRQSAVTFHRGVQREIGFDL